MIDYMRRHLRCDGVDGGIPAHVTPTQPHDQPFDGFLLGSGQARDLSESCLPNGQRRSLPVHPRLFNFGGEGNELPGSACVSSLEHFQSPSSRAFIALQHLPVRLGMQDDKHWQTLGAVLNPSPDLAVHFNGWLRLPRRSSGFLSQGEFRPGPLGLHIAVT